MATDEVDSADRYVRFPGISPCAYEHPADQAGIAALRDALRTEPVSRAVSSAYEEGDERLPSPASSVRVSSTEYPELDRMRAECAAILDVHPVPEVFVERDPVPRAMTIGMPGPAIVLTTGMIDLLDSECLRFVVGHEMGHVLSGHAEYRTMVARLRHDGGCLPAGSRSLRTTITALLEWHRTAELSGDRAGLLCCQDPAVALRAHVLLAGAEPSQVDSAAFLRQAAEYDSADEVADGVLRLLDMRRTTHPLAVLRAAQLQRWAAGDEYRAVLAGDYPRRDEQPRPIWTAEVIAVGGSRGGMVAATIPLTRVGEALSTVAGRVRQRFGGRAVGSSGPGTAGGPAPGERAGSSA